MPLRFAFQHLFGSQPRLAPADRTGIALATCTLVALALVPAWASGYAVLATRDAVILAIFALSYDLLWGRAHTLSLGHGMFFGLGAYALAITNTAYGWSSLGGLAAGLAVALLVAVVLGYFLLYAGVRLHFFAVMTLAALLITGQVATSWSALTGGDVGILGIPGIQLNVLGAQLDLSGPLASYFFALCALAVTLLVLWLACRGNYGKVLAAVGTNELRAKTLGYDTSFHLLVVYAASAAIAAFSGGLFAAATGVVATDIFAFFLSTEVVLWVAIGGRGSFIGPVIATILLTRFRQQVSSYSTDLWPLIVGVLMLVLVLYLPDGVRGLRLRFTRWRAPLARQSSP